MNMVVVMVASGAALVVLVMAVIWYAGTRGRHAGLVSKRDFDAAYDDLTPSDRATRAATANRRGATSTRGR